MNKRFYKLQYDKSSYWKAIIIAVDEDNEQLISALPDVDVRDHTILSINADGEVYNGQRLPGLNWECTGCDEITKGDVFLLSMDADNTGPHVGGSWSIDMAANVQYDIDKQIIDGIKQSIDKQIIDDLKDKLC